MNHFYAVCDLGEETGRVMLGTLGRDRLHLSEIRRFPNVPIQEKDSLQWNIPYLYQETIAGLKILASQDEPVESVSCSSWAADGLLFDNDGSLITPTYHYLDQRTETGMREVFSKVSWETLYEETGVQRMSTNTLYQLGAEKSRRLGKASRLLPVADAFNYFLSGVARVEKSSASATQLYNPVTRTWSQRLLNDLNFPARIFPEVVSAGTRLGTLSEAVVQQTASEDTKVISGCSQELAAALIGFPIEPVGDWAFLRLGDRAMMGTKLASPVINDISREWNFTNEAGFGNSISFFKQTLGLSILEECRRFWIEKDRGLDQDVLLHLAIGSPPFESLVNLADPRFHQPGDMPLKVQAFCRETNQPIPRKPGPVIRCLLESLALLYRRVLHEMEYLTGREFKRLYVLGESHSTLLHHFTANALQMPVTIAPSDSAVIGNCVVQALAQGHLKSFAEAQDIVRNSFKTETIMPHATAWDAAYQRLVGLVPA